MAKKVSKKTVQHKVAPRRAAKNTSPKSRRSKAGNTRTAAAATCAAAVSGEQVELQVGDRVRVQRGVFGNARGIVCEVNQGAVLVQLNRHARGVIFLVDDLRKL